MGRAVFSMLACESVLSMEAFTSTGFGMVEILRARIQNSAASIECQSLQFGLVVLRSLIAGRRQASAAPGSGARATRRRRLQAVLGSSSASQWAGRLLASRRRAHDEPCLDLVAPNRGCDSSDIEIMGATDALTDLVEFLDDGIS